MYARMDSARSGSAAAAYVAVSRSSTVSASVLNGTCVVTSPVTLMGRTIRRSHTFVG